MNEVVNGVLVFKEGGAAHAKNQTFEVLGGDPAGASLWPGRHWITGGQAKYSPDGTAVVPYPSSTADTTVVFTESPTDVSLSVGGGTADVIALVTTTNAGVMSPADKTKLDGLSDIAGQHIDTVSTSAALDALVDSADGSAAVEAGDWAILDTDEGGRQAGLYFHNGTAWPATPGYQFPDTFTQASEGAEGVARIATQAQTDTGTDDLTIVTPLKLSTFIGKRGGQALFGNGSTGPFVVPHAIAGLAVGEKLAIQVWEEASGDRVTIKATNDQTDITITPVAAVATDEYRVTWSKVG